MDSSAENPASSDHSDAAIQPPDLLLSLDKLLLRTHPLIAPDERDKVFRAVHFLTQGDLAGLSLVDRWWQRRDDYPGAEQVADRWQREVATEQYALADIGGIFDSYGSDWQRIVASVDRASETLEPETPKPDVPAPTGPLARYTLRGRRSLLASVAVGRQRMLGGLALTGQVTVLYGQPGIGKSLITTKLITDDITAHLFDPNRVFILDFDNNADGLLQKAEMADEYGFHLLSDGYLDFSVSRFVEDLDLLIRGQQAKGSLLVLDTLKLFTSIMEKDRATEFMKRLRRYSKAGGTCIALGHTNKHPGADGKPVFAGTADAVQDTDNGILMAEVQVDPVAKTRTVSFTNFKARGDVRKLAHYRYSIADDLSYRALLDSVQSIDEDAMKTLEQAASVKADAHMITAITDCIQAGTVAKMDLVRAAGQQAEASRKTVLDVLDRYTGKDAATCKWHYRVRDRGAKHYYLLQEDDDADLY